MICLENFVFAVEGRSLLGWIPLMIMLPGRSEDRMLEKEAVLPPVVIAVSSSSFNSDNGFNGLPNIKA